MQQNNDLAAFASVQKKDVLPVHKPGRKCAEMCRTILAKTTPGAEFVYNAKSAHRVNKAKADKIADLLNRAKYKLKDGEIWYRYEVDHYDIAYNYAEYQQFTFGKTGLHDITY